MTSLMPVATPGWPYPGKIEPWYQFSYITERPFGKRKKFEQYVSAVPQKPRPTGDERHTQLLSAIKNINVKQQATQITDALPDNRLWR